MTKIKKFKLGPLQKLWLKNLKGHPERQTSDVLGSREVNSNSSKYMACCLGELHVCHARLHKKKLPFIDDQIMDDTSDSNLARSFEKYGLRGNSGACKVPVEVEFVPIYARDVFDDKKPKLKRFASLAIMNDNGVPWKQIAKIIQADPENFFTKSV
jgi:hypothetical protein